MTQALPDALYQLCQQSCLELAAGLGMGDLRPLSTGRAEQGGMSHAAVISFTGESIKGSMVVAAPAAFLAKTHPNVAMGMPVGDEELRDWVGELANQILGRFKNKLVAMGHPFTLGMPTLMTTTALHVGNTKDACRSDFSFEGEHGRLSLVVEANLAPGVHFAAADASPAKAGLSEGGGMLF